MNSDQYLIENEKTTIEFFDGIQEWELWTSKNLAKKNQETLKRLNETTFWPVYNRRWRKKSIYKERIHNIT